MTAHTIPAIAAQAARLFGAAPAVIEDGRVTSFAALWAVIRTAASALVGAGLKPGDRVGLWAPNSLDWIVACAGAQLAGGVVVPLNTRLKGAEAAYILNRTRARLLIVENGFLGTDYTALLAAQALPHLNRVIDLRAQWADLLATAGAGLPAPPAPSDPCDIMFTSGTTGDPKGVIALHGQTIRTFQAWIDATGLRAGDRYLIVNPFFHSFGYKAGWLACLMTGATAIPMRTLDMPRLVELVTTHRVTVLPGPPAIFQTMLASDMAAADFSSIRLAVTGAANVPPALVQRMRAELGIATVLTGYGLTESCGVVTMTSAGDPPEAVTSTCGRPIPGVDVRIDAAEGEAGEILVRGYNVMAGYFEDQAATADAIDAEGWLHTGDIGRFDAEGRLMITDRMKDMYISGGFNCYPAEIERTLQRHPDIAQAAVVGVPDERLGEVGHAYVVPAAGRTPDPADLLRWARAEMANYKAPRVVSVVPSLPLNAAGKVQKFLLAAAASQ
jgi:acyl-CoA synthetase (AMP-forming)/AMP-acid ligase II